MIEQLIYWAGVAVILSGALLIIASIIYIIIYGLLALIVKRLMSLYEHAQLHYFMHQIIDKGYVKAMKDVKNTSSANNKGID
tara:strand:+ start:998 stop:1243 length:246 start_codon:yes stop_codon:yes gene_type:complete